MRFQLQPLRLLLILSIFLSLGALYAHAQTVAADSLKQLLKLNPTHENAHQWTKLLAEELVAVDPPAAIEYAKEAIGMSRAEDKLDSIPGERYILGKAYYYNGFPESSLVQMDSLFIDLGEIDNDPLRLQAFVLMAVAYRTMGNFPAAVKNNMTALEIARRTNDVSYQAIIMNNLGNSYMNLNENEEAIRFYRKALGRFEELGSKARGATVLSNIGEIHYQNRTLRIDYLTDLKNDNYSGWQTAESIKVLGEASAMDNLEACARYINMTEAKVKVTTEGDNAVISTTDGSPLKFL